MHKSIPFPAFVATWQGTARIGRDAESQTLRYEIKDTGAIFYTDSQGDFSLMSEILISTEDIFPSFKKAAAPAPCGIAVEFTPGKQCFHDVRGIFKELGRCGKRSFARS